MLSTDDILTEERRDGNGLFDMRDRATDAWLRDRLLPEELRGGVLAGAWAKSGRRLGRSFGRATRRVFTAGLRET